MKVLIFNGMNLTPHLETDMEIAALLMEQGHEVFISHCRGELPACCTRDASPGMTCTICTERKLLAMSMLQLPRKNRLPFLIGTIDESVMPESFATIDELKAYTYKGADIGMGAASSLVSKVRDHRPDMQRYGDLVRTILKTSLVAYENAKQQLDNIRPDEVIFFNGRFAEIRPMMRLCEQRGIPYYTHERGGRKDTYIFYRNATPHAIAAIADEIAAVWEKAPADREEKGRRFFEERRQRQSQSWLSFTKDQQAGRLPAGFDPAKKNIVFYNSSMDEYEGVAGFTSKLYLNDNVGMIRLFEALEHEPNVHLYLRVHPNLKGLRTTQTAELEEMGRRFSNLTLIGADETVDTYALMDAADIVATFNSTTGVEAAYWGKPTVILGYTYYDSMDGFYRPADHEEAVALLKQQLPPLPSTNILQYGYWELERGVPFKYYKAETLFSGHFHGKRVVELKRLGWIRKLQLLLQR